MEKTKYSNVGWLRFKCLFSIVKINMNEWCFLNMNPDLCFILYFGDLEDYCRCCQAAPATVSYAINVTCVVCGTQLTTRSVRSEKKLSWIINLL